MSINTFPAPSATTYYPISVSSNVTATYDAASSYISIDLGTFPEGVYSFQSIRSSALYPASNVPKFNSPSYIQWTTTPASVMYEVLDYHEVTTTNASAQKTFYLSSSTNLTLYTFGVYTYAPIGLDGTESLYSILDDGTSLHTMGITYTYHSTDGVTWTTSSSPLGLGTATMIYASGQAEPYFAYAAEYPSNFYTSTDAITWTTRTSPYSTGANYHVIYDGTKYISVGFATSYKIHTSTDGATWTLRDSGLNYPKALIYGSGETSPYVAVGSTSGTAYFYYSTDAVTWTFTGTKSNIGTVSPKAVLYTGGSYYVYSSAGSYYNYATSTDGVTWSTAQIGNYVSCIKEVTPGEYISSIATNNAMFYSTSPTSPFSQTIYANYYRGLYDIVYHNYSTYKYFAITTSQSFGGLMVGKSRYGEISDTLLPFVLERRPAKVIS